SQYYRNVFDPKTKYIRPKYSGGPWLEDFTTIKGAGDSGHSFGFGSKDYVEANSWQFSWFAPHDMKGLVELMGKEEFNQRLQEGFENSRPYFAADYVNMGNQPNMQAPWLFNYSGKPWLTQYWVREVLENYFGTDPIDGYHGDEDQGQMGAFYVMSAMGLFQMDGGALADPVYELSGPIFEKITIELDQDYFEGKEFVIEAKNSSLKNRYIQSATLNGEKLDKFWFRHSDLVKGGKLVLEMGPEPNKDWAANCEHPQVMYI
ncbi:MAG: glycoside hydrolase family 92 protein, partial [Draconibacterium sp.]|nr:glycoside hydrolase family 92 protein [Draconibacterium sp.]